MLPRETCNLSQETRKCKQLHGLFTQRPKELMDEEAICLNTRTCDLYTLSLVGLKTLLRGEHPVPNSEPMQKEVYRLLLNSLYRC